jgi:hypothetical protein
MAYCYDKTVKYIDEARAKYRPDRPRIVFVAEAPPENPHRFFYYEDIKTGDALFINLIRALYTEYTEENGCTVKEIRVNKEIILERFKADGYYLIDALHDPISLELSPRERIKLIKQHQAAIAQQLTDLVGNGPFNPEFPEVGVILIKATVYEALADYLLAERHIPILNRAIKIPFPSHGNASRFRDALHNCLAQV